MNIEQLHRTFLTCLAVALIVLLAGCASSPSSVDNNRSDRSADAQVKDYQPGSDKGLFIAQVAESMVGVDYRYGGSSPQEGFDCSGLVFYSHTKAGESVPRVSYAQLAASDAVASGDLKPGDLLFYRINGKPSHVGIYIGHGQFVHAPSSGKQVRISSIENVYFKPRLIRAGRLYRED